MPSPLKILVRDNGWFHTGLGLIGNILFVCGSVLFLPSNEEWKTFAVKLFIAGSSLMLIGTLGDVIKGLYKKADSSHE